MQLLVFTAAVLSLLATTLAQTNQSFNTTLSYDPTYDNGNVSTTGIACSNGGNGVICQNCALTLSEIPGWPNISGAPVISGWNSASCRTCWALTLTAPGSDFDNTTLFVRAVDVAAGGFNVGFNLLNAVTNGQALRFGRVNAVARSVADVACEQGQRPNQPVQKPQATCPPPNFGCP